jgi:hypothetical protein
MEAFGLSAFAFMFCSMFERISKKVLDWGIVSNKSKKQRETNLTEQLF